MTKQLSDWKVLGRVIGQASGWDQGDTFAINLYDFTPAKGIALPPGEPFIDFASGKVDYFDDGGNVTQTFDLITILRDIP